MARQARCAIITGGTSGIGLATGQRLLREGFDLVVNARNPGAAVDDLAARAARDGRRVVPVAGDVRDPATAERVCAAATEGFGRIDAVVHAAGGPAPGTAVAMTTADWMDAFDVHVHSAFHLFRAAHPALAVRGGAVVLLSSVAALRGCPGTVAYQTVKAALIQMARALARDHAAEGIRVNCVAPGIIRTPFHAAMTEATKANNLANRIPLGREGTADEVADVIAMLIGNSFITGETMVIDGGMSMRMV